MLEKIIVFSDLDLTNRFNRYNLQIYRLLNQRSQLPVYIYGSNHQGLHRVVGSHRFINEKISEIKNSLIILLGYSQTFVDLDQSNQVLYFLEKPFNTKNRLILPRIDKILTYDYCTAYKIAAQVQANGFQTPVAKILPWFSPDNYQYNLGFLKSKVGYHEIEDYYTSAFNNLTQVTDYRDLWAYAALSKTSSIKDVIASMLSGVPVIAIDEPPFNELIHHGFNGCLVRDLDNIQTVLNFLEKHRFQIVSAANDFLIKIFEPSTYYSRFLQVVNGDFYNLNNFKAKLNEQKWIVRGQILHSGSIEFYPQHFNSGFKIADLQDFMDIIEYFSRQLFTEVYIFGCEFNEYEQQELKLIRRLINRLGDRAKKLFFCLDDVPSRFDKFFDKLGLLSVSEGLKQVK